MAEPRSFDFHKEEFNALKAEIAALVASTTANLQYAIALSGGIFAWLLAADNGPERFGHHPFSLAWFVPGALAVAFALGTTATYVRIRQMGEYLLEVEAAYADHGLGWEKAFKRHSPMLLGIYGCAWLVLILGDFWFGWQVYSRPEALLER